MKIVIGGDVVPKPVSEKYFVSGDAETLFTDVLPILRGADAAIVNLECALTLSDNAIRKFGPNLKADPPAPGISLAKGKDGDRLMNEFASRNEELKNGKWLDGWHEFCVGKSAMYKQIASLYKEDAKEDDKHLFAHYLDCEAHTDVWRELFKTWNHTNELGSEKKI